MQIEGDYPGVIGKALYSPMQELSFKEFLGRNR